MDTSTFPTKGNLMKARRSLTLSRLGYELMDKKRNILMREMVQLIDNAKDIQNKIDTTFADAYESLQYANITLGVCGDIARAVPIDESLTINYKSIMGVEIPTVQTKPDPTTIYYGFTSTNSMLDNAYLKFDEVKHLIAQMAEVENSIYRLANAISKVQKRSNALQNIIIPKFEKLVYYIINVLEERDREEFSRLKMIKKSKAKHNSKEI